MIIKIKKSKFSEIFEELITQGRNLVNFPETINALLLLSIVEYWEHSVWILPSDGIGGLSGGISWVTVDSINCLFYGK